MELLLAVVILNVLITIIFARKKWYVASMCYIFGFLVLLCFILFTSEIPHVTDGLRYILGEDLFDSIYDSVIVYSELAYQPYLAVEVISLIAAIVIALTSAERFVAYLLQKARTRYAKSTRPKIVRVRVSNRPLPQKYYLSYCSMLC